MSEQTPKDFRQIPGHRSIINVESIKKENEKRKHERLLAKVAARVAELHAVVQEHAKRKAPKTEE
jgi:hypothetical protein